MGNMDTQRLIAFMVFSLSAFLLWDAWQKHNAPKIQTPSAQVAAAASSKAGPTSVPTATTSLNKSAQATGAPAATPASSGAVPAGQPIVVQTDVLEVELNTQGGDVRRAMLLKHFSATDKTKPLTLLQPKDGHYFVTQSGLLGDLPNHNAAYTADASLYQLKPGQDKLEVRLVNKSGTGVEVTKVLTFKPGSYVVDVSYQIKNGSDKPLEPLAYYQFVRDANQPEGEASQSNPLTGVATFTGPAVYTAEKKFVKVGFSDIEKGKQSHPTKATDGWLAIVQHYFVSAWLPKQGSEREYFTRKLDGPLYSAGVIVPAGTIAPGQTGSVSMPLYVGPQEQDKLKELSPGLDLVVDYGWLTILAVPLFWLLKFIHGFVGNWGWAIVIMTILIKVVFYPLNQKAGKSMAHMKAVAPRIQQLQQRYGGDRMKLNQAMMELYRTEKINPLGGCLPILVQIPVFIALYWVLLAAIELRHAPWAFWITDLSSPDPYYVLPLIMAVSMFVQTKLNPPPPDPVQAKVMLFMPIVFSIFFFFFPAGLVLYWTVQNLIGIAQQWWINKIVEKETALKAAGKR
jgi:YidC/Oxa1 family membrane protein insertase